MKAIGRNLIINKTAKEISTTKGGLLLAEAHKDDVRYVEAIVVSVGDEVEGINQDDKIYFDKHAGHIIEIDKTAYHVIKSSDIVVVL
jgi:co-chaperonin GroES (HSP10)